MPFKNCATALALATMIATPASAWAFGGVGGCNGLPEYYRALGTLQGMTSACAMTVEEARRILGVSGGPAPVEAAPPRLQSRRHHFKRPLS